MKANKGIRSFFSSLLLLCFLFALAYPSLHHKEHQDENVCHEKASKHFHEKEDKCFVCEFSFKPVNPQIQNHGLILKSSVFEFSGFNSKSPQSLFHPGNGLRGPPSLI